MNGLRAENAPPPRPGNVRSPKPRLRRRAISELPVEVVTQPAQLAEAVQAIGRERTIGVDTESNSRHRYPEQLCLIQIATSLRVFVVDPIVLAELEPLRGPLAHTSVEKVIHGADYDLRSFDRHLGFRLRNVFDTSIAARFCGIAQFGLASLLEELLGVTIPKSERLQRSDWGRRPLSPEALDYAAADVHHLFALREELARRLEALGRTTWVAEECARLEEIRYTPRDHETAFLNVKGARELDGRGLAILAKLFQFRETAALRLRRPPFFVLSDQALTFLAANPDTPFSKVPGLAPSAIDRFGGGLRRAIREGLEASPVARPRPTSMRPSFQETERLRRLKAWRTAEGEALVLDPSLLWPVTSLERLARAPRSLDGELASPDVRAWQRERFAAPLSAALAAMGVDR